MSNFSELLQRNKDFAQRGDHRALASLMPQVPVMIITCLDPRTDPASFLGVLPGDAPVIRNAGGRVTDEVIADVAFIANLARELGAGGDDGLAIEIAVIHHTKCGTGFLADDIFRASFSTRSGFSEARLAAQAVIDPEATVRHDVARLFESTIIPSSVFFSGHVFDLDTGLVTTVVDGVRSSKLREVSA